MANYTGTNGNDILDGSDDDDVLDGLKGADQMRGGKGNDVYYVDNAKDDAIEASGDGNDVVIASVSYTLGANVEHLWLNGGNLNGTGNELDNTIIGTTGKNTLDGGAGADTLFGAQGNDIYIVDNAGDKVIEFAGGGIDMVNSSVTHTLAAHVENLTLTGTGNIIGNGNDLDNTIVGNTGNNVLSGGAGADKLSGGKGDDVYFVDDAGDKIVESANQGSDTVISSVDFSLAAFANVETLTLSGTAAMGTGNAMNNKLYGNWNDNTLNGGTGADEMAGSKGDDTYYIDNAGDKAVEQSGEGMSDLVIATTTIAQLWDNVEHIMLGGNASINATGNGLENYIQGNGGANVIDGAAGADTMSGLGGNDTYVVDNAGDKVVENAGQGTDLVKSSVTFALGASHVENLTLTGNKNIDGFGNGLNNIITGNEGANVLDGGTGNDTLIGDKGNDHYVVDSSGDKVQETISNANGGGIDTVHSSVDFSLAALGNVEHLTLTGPAEKATGNTLDNEIYGNVHANIIDGGKGADLMAGGGSHDTYYVDNAGDVVIEKSSEGLDKVISSIALSDAFANVEDYTFNLSTAVNFTGNSLENVIHGGSGNDTIDGGSGRDWLHGEAGADTLIGGFGNDFLDGGIGKDSLSGGAGNDHYVVDNAGDTITEGGAGGIDSVSSKISLSELFANVENAELTGTGNLNLTGNALDNALAGNDWANTIDGGDGKDVISGRCGNDVLIGGSEADTFCFDLDPKEAAHDGKDTVKDFVKAEDILSFRVEDLNGDGNYDLADLLDSISSVVDKGAGKDVVVSFENGGSITFTGIGTGAVDQITDLVANAAQIQVG